MSFRPMLQRGAVGPLAAALVAGSVALYPRQTAFAEAPRDSRKPIYDDFPTETVELVKPAPPAPSAAAVAAAAAPASTSTSPTPTDILTAQVRQARLFLYSHSLAVENRFNELLSRAFHIENAFTNTVASLAPSPESGERLVPGSVYVAVAAMAGSIVSRHRGIVLRTASPLALGTIAAWTILPVTMRNVSDLIWEYEKKVPAVAEQHLLIRNKAEYIYYTGMAHSGMARSMMEDKISMARQKLEDLVRKGL
ncbi:hypothetical protein ASPZODRAFT_167821 [Penicilliopsis zonata CBS 506.65]|uniref:MICOS complex subunit n=1 Tax=Penicilliopsis zonata CBS 506.65 TaxID=1073090 RepID=A0A1L9SE36_9EURO|nr:hypothetical protein ASPZODRAFT_167821 [Penicilliopsis zonata CBS 506.65]OJJ45373.1 hypothetical protein ASPZODRAFT_167821 [Penicilliopsis zonata CBS 506.65]